jgi:crotonobetainyl-CoA:carnitine CoA-transferase CaiB-like acyl-CoA transferase
MAITNNQLPLTGVRVLEFTHAVLGPACGLVLADLGADVIKIEKPEGDDTRRLKGFGMGYFPFFNRNKRSLAVDVKTEAGRDLVCKLIATADVVIENFAPGTMERLGFGYPALSALHPPLIYCSLKGFLPGPYEHRHALDEVVQMMSGLAYMTGPVGQPLRAGASVIDVMGGTYAALGVLVALRERDHTGRGQLVQSGLFENAAFMMGHHMAYAAASRQPVPPMPARVSAWSVYRTFKTSDGELVFIGVTSDKAWQRFCEAFERPDLLNDERLRTNNDRIAAREWLLPALEAMCAGMPTAEVIRRCEAAGIPFAPIARPEDLFSDPHLAANGALLATALPDGTVAHLPRLPIAVDGYDFGLRAHPPRIGQHSAEILSELGLDQAAQSALMQSGVVSMHTEGAT